MPLTLCHSGKHAEILLVAIYEHAPGWEWQREPTDHFNLWLALEGQGILECDGRSWPFAAGTMFLFPPGMRATGHQTGGIRMINFTAHIRTDTTGAGIMAPFLRQDGPVQLRHFIWASHLCRYLSEAFFLRPTEGRDLVLSGLELLLQSLVYEKAQSPIDPADTVLIQIVERIRRNPAAAYSVAEMAASARLSAAQFTRRFKAVTRLTPNRFLIEERLGRAESYLRETDMSVQEIANRLGYRDVYFFSRQFRRFRGVSPTAVRQ
jgi:AraC-like DNA-binding protein